MSYGSRGSYPAWVCKNLDERLPYPHYSDPTWDVPVCVYGSTKTPADDGAYSDRLQQWDYEKYTAAWGAVTCNDKHTPRAIQEFLSAYYGHPVELVSVEYQTNRGNGYNVSYYRWKRATQ